MYISQLCINMRSRKAQYEHQTPYETHRTIMQAFPSPLPGDERILFRREPSRNTPELKVLIQSSKQPNWHVFSEHPPQYFTAEPQTRSYPLVGNVGERFIFRLVANPTVKRDGKRQGLMLEEDQWHWLLRKGEQSGFTCEREDVRIVQHGLRRSRGNRITHYSAQYDGILTVKHSVRFKQGLMNGIGPAKGFGFGLLSIARINYA